MIDSAPAILEGFSFALREAGVEPCTPLGPHLIGPPLTETLMRLSGSDDARLLRLLADKFKDYYDGTGVATTRSYEGVEAMLDSLLQKDAVLHISTNKRYSVTLSIVERLGWTKKFSSIYALDMAEPRLTGKAQLISRQLAGQKIDPAQTIYVGDKSEDGHAADANGLLFYYASWGYGDLLEGHMRTNWSWLKMPNDLQVGVA